MTKKPSEKNKTWEKDRRDRLNKSFEELAKLLPQYDPTVTWSKQEIVQKAIAYIVDLHEKHEELLEKNDPKTFRDYKELLDALKFFRLRNKQLAELLSNAKITIPPAKYPKFLSDNAELVENIDEFKPRPVGRPKKYSNLTVCNGNCKKIQNTDAKENVDSISLSQQKDAENKESITEVNTKVNTLVSPPVTTTPISVEACNSTTVTTAIIKTTNAKISTGVLLPLIPCQPATNLQTCIQPAPAAAQNNPSLSKCNILSVQTLPPLKPMLPKIARTKSGKVKILPYPVLKLYVHRADNKVPIPALKRNVVTVKKKQRRKRKLQRKENSNEKLCKRKRLSATDSKSNKDDGKTCSEPQAESKVVLSDKENSRLVDNDSKRATNSQAKDPERNTSDTKIISESVAKDDKAKNDNQIFTPDNDLSDEYFSTLPIPYTNPNSASVSPTAAFLLSFPVVNASGSSKTVCETEEGTEGGQHGKNINNSLSEGLENLNNFFSTKEYYRFCDQTLPDKLLTENKTVNDTSSLSAKKNDVLCPEGNVTETIGTKDIFKTAESCSASTSDTVWLTSLPTKTKSTDAENLDGDLINLALESKDKPGGLFEVSKSLAKSVVTNSTVTTDTFSLPTKSTTVDTATSSTSSLIISIQKSEKSSVHSSDFSVSNIFTTCTAAVVTSNPKRLYPSNVKADTIPPKNIPADCANVGVTLSSTESFFAYSTNTQASTSKSKPFFKSEGNTRLPKINPIPNPIPVALPQPTNFPTIYASLPSLEDASQLASKRTEDFDSSLKLVNTSKNITSYEQQNYQKVNSQTTKGNNAETPSIISTVKGKSVNQPLTSSAHFVTYSTQVPFTKASSAVLGPQTQTAGHKHPDNTSTCALSKQENTNPDCKSKIASLSLTSKQTLPCSIASSTLMPPLKKSTFCVGPVSTKENTLKSYHPDAICGMPSKSTNVLVSSGKSNLMNYPNRTSTITDPPSFPAMYPSTNNYYYPPIVPQMNSSFTFNLTPTSSTSVNTTAASSQSQAYYPYPNVNHNVPWIASSSSDIPPTTFTFCLTSSTQTSSKSTQPTNNTSYLKSSQCSDFSISTTLNSVVSNKPMNHIPNIVPFSASYLPNNFSPNMPISFDNNMNTYSTTPTSRNSTSFTFSLAKPKVTTSTVSSDFMKSLPQCSFNDKRSNLLFNDYDFNTVASADKKEAVSFTFALTAPVQSCSDAQPFNTKTNTRFSSSFSIDATLGVAKSVCTQMPVSSQSKTSHNLRQPVQGPTGPQKSSEANKIPSYSNSQPHLKSSNSCNLNPEKQSKPSQKVPVNWMTSTQTSDVSNYDQPTSSYLPSYVASGSDFGNKSNFLNQPSLEENFPPWSPSKIVDTSHLFQSTPAQTFYNEFNYMPSPTIDSCKGSSELPKSTSKSYSGDFKMNSKMFDKAHGNSQSNLFSVSHLVDQTPASISNPLEQEAKKNTTDKLKDSRKNLLPTSDSIMQGPYPSHKPATLNNYSAEALLSKKEKHRVNGPVNTFNQMRSGNYFPSQNDSINTGYMSQDSGSFNYNSNYFYNYVPNNQNYVPDSAYFASSYSDDIQNSKGSNVFNNKNVPIKDLSKSGEKRTHSSGIPLSNRMPFDSTHPSMLPPIPNFEAFEPSAYNNNFQHSNWNVGKHSTVNYASNQTSFPYGSDANVSSCNQGTSGNSGNNLTNFNLTSICPEISDSVTGSNW